MKKHLLHVCILFFAFSCGNKQIFEDPIPIHDSFTLYSKYVNETRVINVWLPPDYENHTSFPVLYMPDGGTKEDFPHITNTLLQLVESKKIPPLILIGIENTERGRDLTGSSEVEEDAKYCPLADGAKNFRAFITEELMTEIHKNYKVSSKKGIIGESLAGLFVMETFFLEPDAFDFYIAMDPSLWWNNHYLERKAEKFLTQFPQKHKKLWFAGSNAEDISTHTHNLVKSLEQNAPKELIWKYSDEPNEKHHTIFRATKEKALIWTLNDIESD